MIGKTYLMSLFRRKRKKTNKINVIIPKSNLNDWPNIETNEILTNKYCLGVFEKIRYVNNEIQNIVKLDSIKKVELKITDFDKNINNKVITMNLLLGINSNNSFKIILNEKVKRQILIKLKNTKTP